MDRLRHEAQQRQRTQSTKSAVSVLAQMPPMERRKARAS
jgi:hypothetical protein